MARKDKRKQQPDSGEEDAEEYGKTDESDDMQDMALAMKTLNDSLVQKRKRKAEEIIKRAKASKDDLMARYSDLVNVTHPAQLNEIYAKLLRSLSTQDTHLAKFWEETAKIDQDAQNAMKQFFTETSKLGNDIQAERRGFKEELNKHLGEEDRAVEVFRKAIAGGNETKNSKKKPRRTDVTLVDSD